MQRLLDRELTTVELAQERRIRTVLEQRAGRVAIQEAIEEMAREDPELFFTAALALLESSPDVQRYPLVYPALLDCPRFLIELLRPDRYSRDQVLETCLHLIKIDTRLDIRMARLVPGRCEDKHKLEPANIVRILDILNEISAGPKLVLIMNHLTAHPDSQVASKAIILMGRRIQNGHWVERHAKSEDPRKRASVVEGLWGRNIAWARQTMWSALDDDNNRVVGNALVGLHLLGESKVGQLARTMLQDPRAPFRFTAAWVMGTMGDLQFLESLRSALADTDQRVRQAARRALVVIRRPIVRQQQLDLVALAQAIQAESAVHPELPPEAETETVVPIPEPVVLPEEPVETPAEPEESEHLEEPAFNLRFDGSYKARH